MRVRLSDGGVYYLPGKPEMVIATKEGGLVGVYESGVHIGVRLGTTKPGPPVRLLNAGEMEDDDGA